MNNLHRQNATPSSGRPKVWIALFVAATLLVAILSFNVEDRLQPASLVVPGTENAVGEKILIDQFGMASTFAVLVEGPPEVVDKVGTRIVAKTRRDQTRTVNSPWDKIGGGEFLRPNPNAAMILIEQRFKNLGEYESVSDRLEDEIRKVDASGAKVVVSSSTIFAVAVKRLMIGATHFAEKIAFPALLLVLLMVFRTPVAAALPLILGGAAIIWSRGIIAAVSTMMHLDPGVLAIASSLGLALGVDYSLLIVSRYREERQAGLPVIEAATMARKTAGRTVLSAGLTLVVVMLMGASLVPGGLLLSMTIGVVAATAGALVPAVTVLPSALHLLGDVLEKWRIPGQPWGGTRERPAKWLGIARYAIKRPLIPLVSLLALLLLVSAPILNLKLGPPDMRQLPRDEKVRAENERIAQVMGPGWAWSYTVAVQDKSGPITSKDGLNTLVSTQRRLEKIPGVAYVLGPAAVKKALDPVTGSSDQLKTIDKRLAKSNDGLKQLSSALGQAGQGADQLIGGLAKAADGAGQLAAGGSRLADGSTQLANGSKAAAKGANRFAGALIEASSGAERLTGGSKQIAYGNQRMAEGISQLRKQLEPLALIAKQLPVLLSSAADDLRDLAQPTQQANSHLVAAIQSFEKLGVDPSDPSYQLGLESLRQAKAALEGADPATGKPLGESIVGVTPLLLRAADELDERAKEVKANVSGEAGKLIEGLRQLDDAGTKLAAGSSKFSRYQKKLSRGLGQVATYGKEFSTGLNKLSDGAGQLDTGIKQVANGNSELQKGLADGAQKGAALPGGLKQMSEGVNEQRKEIPKQQQQLDEFRKNAPNFFVSPYTSLALIDGAGKEQRAVVNQTLAIDRGGSTARIIVVPTVPPNTPEFTELGKQLREVTKDLRASGRYESAVTGIGGQIDAYSGATIARIPILVLGMLAGCAVALMFLFRAILLSLIAVALNVVTVAATFGILTALLGAPGNPLGDAPYIDVIQGIGIFAILFGLSIDYQVFLLARMREERDHGATTTDSIRAGIESTAGVVTGAALAIVVVFIAIAIPPLASLRQTGIGLAIAIALDATIIRLVLLPAALSLVGDRIWWMPDWIDRRLPRIKH